VGASGESERLALRTTPGDRPAESKRGLRAEQAAARIALVARARGRLGDDDRVARSEEADEALADPAEMRGGVLGGRDHRERDDCDEPGAAQASAGATAIRPPGAARRRRGG
jgi:hypothetical protein